MGTIHPSARSIEEDYKDIQDLFQAAKFGKWDEVWRILGTPNKPLKQYLINLIPENRRWGVLQQAVWWNNSSATKTLLKFPTCDKMLKAKEGVSEKGPTSGDTAEEIAKKFGYLEIAKIIEQHTYIQTDEEIDTFYTGNNVIENEEFGLFRLTIAAYKNAFHPSQIDKSKSLSAILNDVFRHVNSGSNWKMTRERIAQALYPVCEEASKCLNECKTQQGFYETIINVYTDESTQLYTYMNTALRRQRSTGYKPTSTDLALGPYILMYHLILSSWSPLKRERNTTHRKMKVADKDLARYQPRTNFTWLSFISSSVEPKYAQIFPSCAPSGDIEVHFIIDNSTDCQWQPRNIENYSRFTERERVYPAGTQFRVQNRTLVNGITTIRLQLLNRDV